MDTTQGNILADSDAQARGEIVLYQPDETIRLEMRMEDAKPHGRRLNQPIMTGCNI